MTAAVEQVQLVGEIVRPFGIEAQVSFESAPLLATPQYY